MKNIIKTLLVVMALVLALAAFTGCELPGTECTHEGYATMGQSVDPTCTETGLSGGIYCSNCDAVISEPKVWEALGHEKTEYIGTTATCTEAGVETWKCGRCGETHELEVEAYGHELADVKAKAATCTEDGYTAHKACAYCDYTEGKEVVTAAGHTLVDVEAKAATCTEDGYTAHKACENCDYTEGKEVVEAGHTLADVEAKAATCTVDGYTAHKACANCDYTEGKETVPATGAHADENGDYKCDACSTKMLPADGTALTIPQALAVAKAAGTTYTTQKYYITGIVTNVYNTTYGNLYLKDAEGNEICIYGLYTWDKAVRYDKMEYKPVEGDELTVYTVLGMYGTTCQGKDAWMDEVVAHKHNYVAVVTDPTCTKEGYTTHTCSICNGYYTDSETAALGHTTEAGTCERCGQTLGGDTPVYETFTADFNTVASTNSSYVSSKTTSGWQATNCAVMGGGTSDSNPKFKVFGDAATRAFTMNGKTSAKGKIVSPTLTGGISALSFNFTNCFSESNGVDITITIKQNGTAVATKRLDQNSVTKLTAYTFEWDLAGEGVAVTGDFTIEITNNSPSNSTSNKDRVSIWNLEWKNNPAA